MSFCSPVQSIDESPLNSNEQFTEVKVVDTEPDIIQRYADLGMRKSPSTSSTEQFIKISLPSNSESIDTFDGPDERYLPSVNGSSEGVSMYIEANAADTLMSNTNEYPTIRNTNDDFSCHNNDLKQTYDDFDTSFHCTKLLSMDFKSLGNIYTTFFS
jgi:hypothetical protein